HRFYARLVAENLTWFDNPDTNGAGWWQINVPRPTARWSGQSAAVTAWPGQTAAMSVSFVNTTGVAWAKNNSTPVRLALDRYQDEGFAKRFNDGSWLSNYRPADFNESSVASGQTATFNFNLKIPDNLPSGSYRFYVRLIQENYAWFEPDINGAAWWQINVPKPSASHVSQSAYPTVSRGETAELFVRFKNTSGITWRADGQTPVRLALDNRWADRTAWYNPSWISQNRIVTAEEGNIAPGQTGTFRFTVSVPSTMPSGAHRFYARLVGENFSWFNSPDYNGAAWWGINVR
ncbi:MAG: hypothetical protein Q8M92_04935, partial [Candidatus Subteraquimicrobiales bacterium]|nr:hypothetical protein [Candidatus Subteraquimicrobiales bacterium]